MEWGGGGGGGGGGSEQGGEMEEGERGGMEGTRVLKLCLISGQGRGLPVRLLRAGAPSPNISKQSRAPEHTYLY